MLLDPRQHSHVMGRPVIEALHMGIDFGSTWKPLVPP